MSKRTTPEGWTVPTSARSGPELSQDRAVRTRAQVLEAAAEVFAACGFRNASVQAIASAAGVTKGAVYFHYTSKENLAVAVVEAHYGRWPKILEDVQAQGLSPLNTALVMLDRAAIAFRDDIVVAAGARLQIERSMIDVPLPTPYVGWTSLQTDLLRAAAAGGELQPGVDPAAAARTLVSAFFGMQHVSDVLTGRQDILDRWQEMRGFLRSALAADGEAAG